MTEVWRLENQRATAPNQSPKDTSWPPCGPTYPWKLEQTRALPHRWRECISEFYLDQPRSWNVNEATYRDVVSHFIMLEQPLPFETLQRFMDRQRFAVGTGRSSDNLQEQWEAFFAQYPALLPNDPEVTADSDFFIMLNRGSGKTSWQNRAQDNRMRFLLAVLQARMVSGAPFLQWQREMLEDLVLDESQQHASINSVDRYSTRCHYNREAPEPQESPADEVVAVAAVGIAKRANVERSVAEALRHYQIYPNPCPWAFKPPLHLEGGYIGGTPEASAAPAPSQQVASGQQYPSSPQPSPAMPSRKFLCSRSGEIKPQVIGPFETEPRKPEEQSPRWEIWRNKRPDFDGLDSFTARHEMAEREYGHFTLPIPYETCFAFKRRQGLDPGTGDSQRQAELLAEYNSFFQRRGNMELSFSSFAWSTADM